jgi:acyl-Coa thioesterase superfamily protein/acyl-CoA thioesterase superfamily protein
MSSLYEPAGDGRWRPHEATRGPWNAAHQHGGAPAALIGGLVERAEPGAHLRVARVTVELVRPVPLEELRSEVEIVRPGKRVQLVAARLYAGEDLVVRALALRLRRDGASAAPPSEPAAAAPTGPEQARPLRLEHVQRGLPMFNHDGVDVRYARGDWGVGSAFAWIALRVSVIAGEEPTPLQRALAAADFGNGVSAAVDWSAWAFINPDLTLYLEREPEGPWVGLDAETRLGPDGTAVAESVLHDERGRIGRAVQALLVEPRA